MYIVSKGQKWEYKSTIQQNYWTPSSLKDIDEVLTHIPKVFLKEADPHQMKIADCKHVGPRSVETRRLMILETSPWCQPIGELSTTDQAPCGPLPHPSFKPLPWKSSGRWYSFMPSPLCTSYPSNKNFACLRILWGRYSFLWYCCPRIWRGSGNNVHLMA